MQKVNILGVEIDAVSMKEATGFLQNLLLKNQKGYFVTPNPEIILEANKNQTFKAILNKADLKIPDGIGLLWAANHLYIRNKFKTRLVRSILYFSNWLKLIIWPQGLKKVIPQRVTGSDLTIEICKIAAKLDKKVFLLGAREGVARKAKNKLEELIPHLKISGFFSGSPLEKDEKEILEKINKSNAEIVFVAFGAPKQEEWIAKNLSKLKNIQLAGGVGGTFDFLAETKKRSPKWMQKLSIEWLYRLIIEPSRWKRIYNATIKFPFKVISSN